MAKTKSKGKVKKASRTGSNKAGKSQNFSWVFIVIGVIAVVVTGVLVVRFSNASTVQNYKLNVKTAVGGPDEVTTQLTFSGFATLNRVGTFRSGAIKWKSTGSGSCFTVAHDPDNNAGTSQVFKELGTKQQIFYPHQAVVASKKSSCNL